ncbi:MAG: alpha/beta fold hydrolase [Methylococcales bacterium]|nr:MAG: alpha/beta fold hydrolase [Methylococcales bacterium]
METVALAFEELGEASRPPLLILHGFFASSRNWRQVAEKLAVDYHVYVLDMRNHGSSPQNPQMDYVSMSADVLRFMDDKSLNTASLLGHSMGGKVAMWFALNHPVRVNKLIVADIAPVTYSHCFNKLIAALKALPLPEINNRKQAELLLAEDIPELSYRQFLLQNIVLKAGCYHWRIDLDIFQQSAPAIIGFPDTQSLKPYTKSCLFLAGSESAFVKEQDVKSVFPDAILSVIDKAGHWLHVQQPQLFIKQVQEFLSY